MTRSVDHGRVLAQTRSDTGLSSHYAFMVVVAAGIAMIGLLLNSPTVIIGAMLVSPLMGPIVGLGFAIATLDVALGRRAAFALLAGTGIAVAAAAGITAVSPVQELTAELLARTRPNLFDLAVAVLSGAAGGYALIRGLGGTIVGVAIATALMPPLATLGYGLATSQASAAYGAALLFITNMAAIALSVAAVALWYGFGRGELRMRFARQALISLLVLAPLAVPLWTSLRTIVWETRVQSTVRSVLEAGARALRDGQIAQVKVQFGAGRSAFVDAIVVSLEPQPDFARRMNREIVRALGQPVTLHLTQLRADDPEAVRLGARGRGAAVATAPPPADAMAAWKLEFPLATLSLQVDEQRKRVVAVPEPHPAISLAAWLDLERAVAARHPGWQIHVVPPPAALPSIRFSPGSARLDADAIGDLEVIHWALARWSVRGVVLTGHASTSGHGPLSLAQRRLSAVAAYLQAHDVRVKGQAFYPAPLQVEREREVGEAAYRSVEVALAPAPNATSPASRP